MTVTASWYLWMDATAYAPVKSLARLAVVRRMIHFLVGSCCGGLDEGDSVVVPLDGGHSDRPGQVLGVVGSDGGEDDPLLSGDILLSISPTPALLASALKTVAAA